MSCRFLGRFKVPTSHDVFFYLWSNVPNCSVLDVILYVPEVVFFIVTYHIKWSNYLLDRR